MQFLIALDQLVNTVFGGWADESISARAYRLKDKGWDWQYKAINKIFFWQDNHCASSYFAEELRTQLPREYR